ncbi:hypothetical protein GQS65_00215 [Halomarina oriensis]|uniref:SAM-dependent methyltransferase n=1 Tax=Halomarina oriensis TaxID=671145 RepID=A0A6B0GEH6_9EURY|nr:hypothetical protein [Halomarina oriensis]MWG32930.1 hypothetical protein [Halomarina oriensis]
MRRAWDIVAAAANRRADGEDSRLVDESLDALGADPKVLDVECGDGARTLVNLPPGAVGLDFSRRQLELAAAPTTAVWW